MTFKKVEDRDDRISLIWALFLLYSRLANLMPIRPNPNTKYIGKYARPEATDTANHWSSKLGDSSAGSSRFRKGYLRLACSGGRKGQKRGLRSALAIIYYC